MLGMLLCCTSPAFQHFETPGRQAPPGVHIPSERVWYRASMVWGSIEDSDELISEPRPNWRINKNRRY